MQVNLVPYHDASVLVQSGLHPVDFYQYASYVSLDATLVNGEPFILLVTASDFTAAIPLIRRPLQNAQLPGAWYDGASPYGYPGILFSKVPDQNELAALQKAIIQTLQDHHWLAAFIRLHPFFNDQTFGQDQQVRHLLHGQTVYIDLTASIDILRANYSTNHKRNIRSLLNNGYFVRINDFTIFHLFIQAYAETMSAAQAKNYYHFDTEYFEALHRQFGNNLTLISAHHPNGSFASGAIFIQTGGLVQYHLGGTDPLYKKEATSKLVFDAAIRHFHEQQKQFLHLGGGYGSTEDALFQFKAGFSSGRKQFSTLRIIGDLAAYKRISGLTDHPDPIRADDFFPFYRKFSAP